MTRSLRCFASFSLLLSSSALAANLTGKTAFSGTAPKGAPLLMSAAPECAKAHKAPVPAEEIIVNEGGLANVFIYVKEGLKPEQKPKDAPPPVTVDQNGCLYVPRIIGVQVGQTLRITNSDPTMHNVSGQGKANPRFNVATVAGSKPVEKKFTKPEIMMKLRCDVHPWMTGYIGVLDHPYFAVSDPKGNFTIAGLAPGDYVVEAWHEKLGTQTAKVTVSDAAPAPVTLTFKK